MGVITIYSYSELAKQATVILSIHSQAKISEICSLKVVTVSSNKVILPVEEIYWFL